MILKKFIWIGGLALIFFFLPSLAYKIWNFIIFAPWAVKSWLFYLILAVFMIKLIRWRLRLKKTRLDAVRAYDDHEKPLLIIAQERLVKGEITLEEYREIRQELKEIS